MPMKAVACAPGPDVLPEGPVWDAEEETLLWVDRTAGRIRRASLLRRGDASGLPDLRLRETLTPGHTGGAVVPCASGGLLVGSGAALVRRSRSGPDVRVDLPVPFPDGVRRWVSEARCDPRGRLLAGTMAFDARSCGGSIHRLDPDGSVSVLVHHVSAPSGLGWSPDGRILYAADAAARRIDAFDYDPETGRPANRRTFAFFDTAEPRGLAVDAGGRVWVALWGGGGIHAYAPDGTLAGVVEVAAAHVSGCAFAGPELDVLMITTARPRRGTERAAPDGPPEPDAGRLFLCRPGPTGLPTPPYDDSRWDRPPAATPPRRGGESGHAARSEGGAEHEEGHGEGHRGNMGRPTCGRLIDSASALMRETAY